MKKFLKIVLIATMVCSMVMCSACKKDEDTSPAEKGGGEVIADPEEAMFGEKYKDSEPVKSDEMTPEKFYDMVEGCWVYEDANKLFDLMWFEDGKMNMATYCSEVWLNDGVIEEVRKVGDNYEIRVSYVYYEFGEDDEGEYEEVTFRIGSNDNFDKTIVLISDDGDRYVYEYMGKKYDEVTTILNEKMFS